jgi:hypothetical protein
MQIAAALVPLLATQPMSEADLGRLLTEASRIVGQTIVVGAPGPEAKKTLSRSLRSLTPGVEAVQIATMGVPVTEMGLALEREGHSCGLLAAPVGKNEWAVTAYGSCPDRSGGVTNDVVSASIDPASVPLASGSAVSARTRYDLVPPTKPCHISQAESSESWPDADRDGRKIASLGLIASIIGPPVALFGTFVIFANGMAKNSEGVANGTAILTVGVISMLAGPPLLAGGGGLSRKALSVETDTCLPNGGH